MNRMTAADRLHAVPQGKTTLPPARREKPEGFAALLALPEVKSAAVQEATVEPRPHAAEECDERDEAPSEPHLPNREAVLPDVVRVLQAAVPPLPERQQIAVASAAGPPPSSRPGRLKDLEKIPQAPALPPPAPAAEPSAPLPQTLQRAVETGPPIASISQAPVQDDEFGLQAQARVGPPPQSGLPGPVAAPAAPDPSARGGDTARRAPPPQADAGKPAPPKPEQREERSAPPPALRPADVPSPLQAPPPQPVLRQVVEAIAPQVAADAAVRPAVAAEAPQAPLVRSLQVSLHPRELGRLRLTLRLAGEQLDLTVETETADALASLARDKAMIGRLLQEAGVNAETARIDLRLGRFEPGQRDDGRHGSLSADSSAQGSGRGNEGRRPENNDSAGARGRAAAHAQTPDELPQHPARGLFV